MSLPHVLSLDMSAFLTGCRVELMKSTDIMRKWLRIMLFS